MSSVFNFAPLLASGVFRPKLDLRLAGSDELALREQELRKELAEVEAERARRAKASPPGLMRIAGLWTPERASTLP